MAEPKEVQIEDKDNQGLPKEYTDLCNHFQYIKEHPDEWLAAQSPARQASIRAKDEHQRWLADHFAQRRAEEKKQNEEEKRNEEERRKMGLLETQQKSPVHTEMGDDGRFRIVSFGRTGEETIYEGIATLEVDGEILIAVTSYFAGCGLEPEVVYTTKPV